eukprot:gene12452-44791_t
MQAKEDQTQAAESELAQARADNDAETQRALDEMDSQRNNGFYQR